ncbi:MAG: hypothetical protein ABJ387_03560 [Balneola sp.]
MDIGHKELLQSLRAMAWERAKAKLNSITAASYTDSPSKDHDKILRFIDLKAEFIKKVEEEELIEDSLLD